MSVCDVCLIIMYVVSVRYTCYVCVLYLHVWNCVSFVCMYVLGVCYSTILGVCMTVGYVMIYVYDVLGMYDVYVCYACMYVCYVCVLCRLCTLCMYVQYVCYVCVLCMHVA